MWQYLTERNLRLHKYLHLHCSGLRDNPVMQLLLWICFSSNPSLPFLNMHVCTAAQNYIELILFCNVTEKNMHMSKCHYRSEKVTGLYQRWQLSAGTQITSLGSIFSSM